MKDLKEVLPYYLNTGLKVQVTVNDGYDTYIPRNIIDTIDCFSEECVSFANTPDYYFGDDENQSIIKPCLLPLSALTEPLEDGIVPIEILAKIHDNSMLDDEWISVSEENDNGIYYMCHYGSDIDKNITCHFVITHQSPPDFQSNALFQNTVPAKYEFTPVHNQFKLFQKLFEWHFDVFGLIESGQAIDKRTIN